MADYKLSVLYDYWKNISDWVTGIKSEFKAKVSVPDIENKLDEKLGEVQASPTVNTLLGRIKELETSLTNIKTGLGGKNDVVAGSLLDGSTIALIKRLITDLQALNDSLINSGAGAIPKAADGEYFLTQENPGFFVPKGCNKLCDGQATAYTTVTQLSIPLACEQLLIQSDPENTSYVYLGNIDSQSIKLRAGETYTMALGDVSALYIKSADGSQVINWHAIAYI